MRTFKLFNGLPVFVSKRSQIFQIKIVCGMVWMHCLELDIFILLELEINRSGIEIFLLIAISNMLMYAIISSEELFFLKSNTNVENNIHGYRINWSVIESINKAK